MRELSRLLNPQSIAVIGGGAWCEQVIIQLDRFGFKGNIWPMHPKRSKIAGHEAFTSLDHLPNPPDATFVGINRRATIDAIRQLSAMGAGGATCFASGFSEAAAEDDSGTDLQQQLIDAAGDMPILGPNCYGFINALDTALIWPDQHGCTPVDTGVAILTQSSNISINLTMQQRALPIAYMIACGNMAQTSQAQIASALLDDPRVTAIGVHIEGFHDLRDWEALAQKAYAQGVPIVALKVGASDQAQATTISHTASVAGSDAGAQAFLDRLGIPRLRDLPSFLETLKMLHCHEPLENNNIASISCSGGEASLIADMALNHNLTFPPLTDPQHATLRDALGPMVALSNPLDYHTYIWRDRAAMAKAWSGMTGDGISMTFSIIDYPTTDPTDWIEATGAALDVRRQTGKGFAVVSTLPELMPLDTANDLMAGGVVPFMGLHEALSAIEAAANYCAPTTDPVTIPSLTTADTTLTEAASKAALAAFGISTPASCLITKGDDTTAAIKNMTPPFAVKGTGLAHKSDSGAVKLGVMPEGLTQAIAAIGTETVLIEEMITDAIAELLIGVVRDPAHGFVLTIGAGGVMTELLRDTTSLLLPTTAEDITEAIDTLRIAPLLHGFRDKPAANLPAITDAILSVQSYVLAHADHIGEVEINPLICTPTGAIAADALIRRS
ncbi:acetyl-CoA synthetase [Cognatiyoonia sediminum]|uniref:Acetyl-CoA synthetase n=1 Tax=Cognatiyoonia sediminum TaxID=1508389 RepID=A0A1M5T3D5_9RHOB|nr:acetate--CoA ligase family protein [Cognatiyoonia sediminum]SHH45257.1 acetyl-CoA synthetase [Cognatiyoonia sediminum]